jgi:hypothetical protein
MLIASLLCGLRNGEGTRLATKRHLDLTGADGSYASAGYGRQTGVADIPAGYQHLGSAAAAV